ncbi:hypothetical protein M3Y97_00452000 [Aphelenchoides bicaudatus]|nr:hypothetical protein M3Y97_00452000 [Aphelenchoides bicaudatus]
MSLLSAMPSTATSRFRASTTAASKAYTPPILSRYTPGLSSRRSNIMSRSYTPSYASQTPRVTIATTYSNYSNYRLNRDDKSPSGWKTVENPPTVYERHSRKDRSTSATRKRRSRSKSNQPPPPGSSSDSDQQEGRNQEERVPPRTRRLRQKSNSPARGPENNRTTDKAINMPAAVGQFESALESRPIAADVVAANKASNDPMETSIHSTTTNASEMFPDEPIDESKYNAVTSFKPAGLRAKRVKSPQQKKIPVPGTWPLKSVNEVNISQNKALRRASDQITIEITMKDFPYIKASTAYLKMPRAKKQSLMFRPFAQKQPVALPKIESKTISASFMRPKIQNQATSVTIKNRKPTVSAIASLKTKEPKPKLRVTAETTINQHFTNKKRLRLGVEKSWKLKGFTVAKTQLSCKSITDKGKLLNLNINRKPDSKACNGTVKDDKDVVFAKVESGVCMAPVSVKFTLAQPPKIFSPANQYDGLSSPEPYEPQLHVPLGRNDRQGGPLVLPDRSTLEEYVKRKRNHLETIRKSGQSTSSNENSLAESPPPSLQPSANTTELQACPVRILEPHIQQPIITTPTRSRISSVEPASSGREQSMTPRPNEASGILGPQMQAQTSAQLQPHNQQQPVAGDFFKRVLRKTSDPTGGNRLKAANVFDTPKSPFEERMQQQANQLRKTSVCSSDTDNEGPAKNRASIDGGIAQGFVAALTAQQPARHERYAAHIPISSGRQSVTSVDSVNSGALDQASKQLDAMIDQARTNYAQKRSINEQARYKHQQHRTKFKEAIDYLDQIFEDLKKECEPGSPPKSNTGDQQFQQQLKPKPFPVNQQQSVPQQPQEKRFQKSVSQDPALSRDTRPAPQKPLSRVIQPQPPAHLQRIQHPIHQAPTTAASQRPVLRKQRSNVESGQDIEVNETIVLPTKNNGVGRQSQPIDEGPEVYDESMSKVNDLFYSLLIRKNSSGLDSDEHSLGSCSVEVAAINTKTSPTKQQKQQEPKQAPIKKPIIQEPPKASGPVKPRAYRPQPQNGAQMPKNLPITVLNAPDSNAPTSFEIQKVPSHQDLRRSPTRESTERPSSQDYQSVGSSHSQEGFRPPNQFHSNSLQRSVSGAFVQYPQRGSIQSLPDAILVAGNQKIHGSSSTLQPGVYPANNISGNSLQPPTVGFGPQPTNQQNVQQPPPDPAVQALMAELDINATGKRSQLYEEMSPEDPEEKRRSFPTTHNDVAFRSKPANVVQRPIPKRLGVPQQPQTYTNSMDRGMSKLQQQQMHNPFTNKVLGPQKSPPPPDPNRKQFDDATDLLDSVIDELKPTRSTPTQAQRQQMFRQQQQSQQYSQQRPTGVNAMQKRFEQRQASQAAPSQRKAIPLRRGPPHSTNNEYAAPSNYETANDYRQEENEEEAFYDNIQNLNAREEQQIARNLPSMGQKAGARFGQPMLIQPTAPVPPPHKFLLPQQKGFDQPARIGQLIRKLGGVAERPVVHQHQHLRVERVPSTGSVLSLNRIGHDATPKRAGMLMKSNSLSHEPWRIYAMDGMSSSGGQQNNDSSKNGFGNRIKQTFFGSKKWLNNS